MCFAAPGPRCLSHTTAKLDEKKLKHEKMTANYNAAEKALNAIPEGQEDRKQQMAWLKAYDAYQRSEAELAEAQAAYDNALKYDPRRLDGIVSEGQAKLDPILAEETRLHDEGLVDDYLDYKRSHEAEKEDAIRIINEGLKLKDERQAMIDKSNELAKERKARSERSLQEQYMPTVDSHEQWVADSKEFFANAKPIESMTLTEKVAEKQKIEEMLTRLVNNHNPAHAEGQRIAAANALKSKTEYDLRNKKYEVLDEIFIEHFVDEKRPTASQVARIVKEANKRLYPESVDETFVKDAWQENNGV